MPACLHPAARHVRIRRVSRSPPASVGRRAAWFQQIYFTRKVSFRLTRHSVTLPSPSVTTLISLTQAPWMFFTVSDAFFSPTLTASSMLLFDAALISMILATDMDVPSRDDGRAAGGRRLRRGSLRLR